MKNKIKINKNIQKNKKAQSAESEGRNESAK